MSNEFTDNELRSIAVNAAGRTSEAGGKAVIRIGLAVPEKYLEEKGKIDYPAKGSNGSFNSGFSVGVFQWDIGQKKNGKEIIEAYNNSEYVKSGKGESIKKVDEYALVLQQNRDVDRFGKENSNEKDRYDIRRIDDETNRHYRTELARPLNAFFNTDEGYKFIMSLQERQYVENLKPAMEEALKSPSVQSMSKDDAVEVLSAIAKEKNQAGSVHANVKQLLEDKEKLHTKDEIIGKIYASHGDYVDDGVKKTLEGAELYNILSNDKGTLGEIFREYNKSDPIDMSNFHQSPNAQLIDAMFRNPEEAGKFIKAVNNGKDHVINIEKESGNKGIEKEIYIAGVKDGTIFTMQEVVENDKVTGSSKGYKLEDGEWKEFDNNKEKFLKLKNSDWSINPQTSQYQHKTELSPEMIEFAKEQLNKDMLLDEFKEKLLITQNTFELCDEEVKDCILNPTITNEELQAFAKQLEEKENAKEKETLASKDKDDDNVRRMDRHG
jgi:hypothetical protein